MGPLKLKKGFTLIRTLRRKNLISVNGFTLIELIVVITIVAILTVIFIVALRAQMDRANDAKRKADLQRIAVAFEEYYSDKNCYPSASILNTCGGSGLKNWGLNSIPCDPVFNTPYCYITDADKPACFQKFRILNTLKYLPDPIIKTLGCDGSQFCGWELECGSSGEKSGFNYGVSSLNTTVTNPNMPVGPTPPPAPTSGPSDIWGCTKQGDTCNNYGLGNPACPREFSSFDICLQYCSPQSVYRCSI